MAARYQDLSGPGRRSRRSPALPPPLVEVTCAGGGPQLAAQLVDVSTFGCRLAGDGVEGVGDHVRLQLSPAGNATATVVWRDGGAIGCRFDRPIPTTLMKSLLCRDA